LNWHPDERCRTLLESYKEEASAASATWTRHLKGLLARPRQDFQRHRDQKLSKEFEEKNLAQAASLFETTVARWERARQTGAGN